MKTRLIVFATVLAILAVGWWYGRPAYRHYKEKRLVPQALAFLQKKEYPKAWLSVRQIFALDPTNVAACRIMADLAELGRSPQTVVWRRKVAELDPSIDNRLVLASCALRFENPPFPLATKTLESLPPDAKQNPTFHVVSAERAIKLNHLAEAETHLLEAGKLEPTNQLHQLNVTVLRLQSPDAKIVAEARTRLESFIPDSQYGIVALRSLAAEALNRKDFSTAERFSSQVLANTNSSFSDRIQHLDVLSMGDGRRKTEDGSRSELPSPISPLVSSNLSALQRTASTNVADIYELATWLNRRELSSEALTWLTSLAPTVRTQAPVPVLIADCYMLKKDWPMLENWLREQKWGDQEFLRLAILSRALRSQGETNVATINWNRAVRAASEKADLLAALLRVAQGWGWATEAEELLWQIAKQFPDERWAMQLLEKTYLEARNTAGLFKVYSAMNRVAPKDLLVKNNLATICLLLKTNTAQAHQFASEVYAQYPTNSAVATTYAFSLHTQGKTSEGLAALTKLPAQELQQPSTAAYYAVLLNAAGDAAQAEKYAALATRAPLLPEEAALLRNK